MTNGNARIADDLTWYWNWAEGELGVPSNFMATVAAMSAGGRRARGVPSREIDEGRFAAATRMRLITRSLKRLTDLDLQVLFAVFGPHAGELPILERAAPVAVHTKVARAAHQASGTTRSIEDWLLRLVHRAVNRLGDHVAEDRATAHAIALEANGMLTQALRAFSMAWRLDREQLAREPKAVPARAVSVPGGPSAPARAHKTALGEGPR